ncbi:aminopeptidase [Clostridium fallax]|uniref:Aminopeptidase II. Metallo peptidase. MEROPS family M29 n=1 Tax=Clostridium fallax TaxID=1533 RepID=A0A1M4WWT2_9CLOT|nr:aminopeptidase [Clostridium fallax]SHE85704.1 aminopeptidase II. Metallo peptidase. MEROPS family M29 [Clostridium fallax]SQB07451.1 aminopeptidase II [Clostridium fallax]
MNSEMLEKYATLAVKTGVNIQKNQTLVLRTPIECADFARIIANKAYDLGAKEVVVLWSDEKLSKITYLKGADEIFDSMPKWQVDSLVSYAREGAAFLSIFASDPELMKDVDPKRIARASKSRSIALKEFYERTMTNKNSWSIVAIPTIGWATKVFPNLTKDEAVEKLWDAIFKIVRVDKMDPVKAWEEHTNNLKEKMDFLNSKSFKRLHYKNSKGTNLTIELPEGHIWAGGAEKTQDGIEFIANIPTEEVFTLPKKTGVNGVVHSSKPLNYNGNLIDNFSLTFKDGKVCDFTAEKGYDTLKHLIETDEGSHYLGEVALVPYHSPISLSGIIFFNTLFDENASCHLALGKAYAACIKNGENYTEKELDKLGVNNSLTHVDFMVGTKDLNILGETKDGEKCQIFLNGDWAF